jgi:hypothetical protein
LRAFWKNPHFNFTTPEVPDSGNAAVPERTPDLILTRED